jgi:SAM-dependent methyltransferase
MQKSVAAADPDAYVAALDGWRQRYVQALRAAVVETAALREVIRWGHLVYFGNGPVLLIRAEAARVLFGFWRGQRLRGIEPRLKPGGKYQMATFAIVEGTPLERATVSSSSARRSPSMSRSATRPGSPTRAPSRPPMAEPASYLLAGQASELERLQLQSRVWEPAGEALLAELTPPAGCRAVDVGCGMLGWLRVLSRWVGPEGQVVGTDVEPKMLSGAQAFVAAEALDNVSLLEDDLFQSALPAASFDLVHARFQIAPLGRAAEQMAAYRRLLRPGGTLVLEDPDMASWRVHPHAPAVQKLIALIERGFLAAGGNFNSGRELPELVRGIGLEPKIRARVVALEPAIPTCACRSSSPRRCGRGSRPWCRRGAGRAAAGSGGRAGASARLGNDVHLDPGSRLGAVTPPAFGDGVSRRPVVLAPAAVDAADAAPLAQPAFLDHPHAPVGAGEGAASRR